VTPKNKVYIIQRRGQSHYIGVEKVGKNYVTPDGTVVPADQVQKVAVEIEPSSGEIASSNVGKVTGKTVI
jgi:hypothetical protein